MNFTNALSLPKDAWSIARTEGFSPTLKAGLRRLNASYEGYYYYINYRYKWLRGHPCVDEQTFFRVLEVDPHMITALPNRRFDKWRNAGEIRNGEWDRPTRSFDTLPVVEALRERFDDGREWEDIGYVQRAIDTVRSGDSTWNGCRTVEDIHERCRTLDRLYESIRKDGFKTQAELHDADPKSILLNGSFDRSKTDVVVHVGRDGELLFVDGRHRLAIAKLLELKEIPVRVAIRHVKWQRIRDKARGVASSQELRESVKIDLAHPDLVAIIKANECLDVNEFGQS